MNWDLREFKTDIRDPPGRNPPDQLSLWPLWQFLGEKEKRHMKLGALPIYPKSLYTGRSSYLISPFSLPSRIILLHTRKTTEGGPIPSPNWRHSSSTSSQVPSVPGWLSDDAEPPQHELNMSGPWKLSAEEEYKRCPEVKRSEVAMIQEWLTKQPHLPPISG